MSQTLPDLNKYPDFVHLLNNAGYEAEFSYDEENARIPVLTVKNASYNWKHTYHPFPAILALPNRFREWLDTIAKELNLYRGFELEASVLSNWGFVQRNGGVWSKPSPHQPGEVLFIDPEGLTGGRLLYSIDMLDEERMHEKARGPVTSLTVLHRMLLDRGWLDMPSEFHN
jgi:hypothetical protein